MSIERTKGQGALGAKLSEVWSQVGFEHFRDGVHVLDLGTVTLDEAVERLRERISRLG